MQLEMQLPEDAAHPNRSRLEAAPIDARIDTVLVAIRDSAATAATHAWRPGADALIRCIYQADSDRGPGLLA